MNRLHQRIGARAIASPMPRESCHQAGLTQAFRAISGWAAAHSASSNSPASGAIFGIRERIPLAHDHKVPGVSLLDQMLAALGKTQRVFAVVVAGGRRFQIQIVGVETEHAQDAAGADEVAAEM